MPLENHSPYVLWFNEVDKEDIPLVGDKGANLGEMTKIGAAVPDGFIVTTTAYFYFLKENNLEEKIRVLLRQVNPSKPESYQEVAEKIQRLIINSPMPKDLALQIMKAYLKLGKGIQEPLVAVRSSATAGTCNGLFLMSKARPTWLIAFIVAGRHFLKAGEFFIAKSMALTILRWALPCRCKKWFNQTPRE